LWVLLVAAGCKGAAGDVSGGTAPGGEETGSATDDTGAVDADGDGWTSDEDCDDGDPAVHPGADEVCNATDDDCDGETDEGFEAPWCLTGDAPCPLGVAPLGLPEPVLHLAFESDDPLGSSGSAAITVLSDSSSEAEGAVGQGRRFDRVGAGEPGNSVLVVQTTPELAVTDLTISAWIHPEHGLERGTIVNTLWDSAPSGFALDVYSGFLWLRLGDGTDVESFHVPVAMDHWSHVAATFDGEYVALYVDGERRLRQPVSDDFGGVVHLPADLSIGAYQTPSYYAFDGVIDELKIFDTALTGAQIRRDLVVAGDRFEDDDSRTRVCGPVGNAWSREAGDDALTMDAPLLRARLGLSAWVRADRLEGTQGLIEQEGAYSLRLEDSEAVFEVSGEEVRARKSAQGSASISLTERPTSRNAAPDTSSNSAAGLPESPPSRMASASGTCASSGTP